MYKIVHATLPTWLGGVLLALGAAVLLASPRIVSSSILVLERLHNWFLGIIAKASGIRYTLSHDSFLWRVTRMSYWLIILLVGSLLVLYGTMVLFNSPLLLKYTHWKITDYAP